MSNQILSIQNLVLSYPMNFISSIMNKNKGNIPEIIDNYKFVKLLQLEKDSDIAVALYKDKNNKKVVAKIWTGQYKNYSRLTLTNEARVYESLNKATARLKNTIPVEFKKIRIPKLIKVIDDKNSLIILVEWIEGKPSSKVDFNKRLDAYFEVNNYFEYLGNHMNAHEKAFISSRNSYSYFLLYPFLLCKAVIVNSNSFIDLIKGLIIFIKFIPTLIKSKKLSLVHRDLHFDNILINGKNIYVIDLQFCAFTYRTYELVTTLRNTWGNNKIHNYLFDKINENYKNTATAKLIKPLIIISATHALSDYDFSRRRINDFKDYLRFGVSL
jgi:serine/threonine protein kinase